MKFDVVVGNPPYNRAIKIENNPLNAGYIYIQFIIDAMKNLNDEGIMQFVLPTSWLTFKKFIKFRNWLKSNYEVSRIDVLENLISQKYFKVGQNICVLTVTKKSPTNRTLYCYDLGPSWYLNLNKHDLWPMFATKNDMDLYELVMGDTSRKIVKMCHVTEIENNGKGYVTGNVVGFVRGQDFTKNWVANQKLPSKGNWSSNNQWAAEFPTTQDADDYLQYAKTQEFRQLIDTLVPGYKLQPYLLSHLGYRDIL
jgi:hypothetical protein